MHPALTRAIEPLEPRIAPAALPNLFVAPSGLRATWTDVDGDLVTLTATKPVLDRGDFTFLDQASGDRGFQLALLDLSDDYAQGTSLTFSARRDPVAKAGDGFVNVGWIDAHGSDLVTIIVPGDLARLDVGNDNPATTALASIVVHSAGFLGGRTQGATIGGGAPTLDWAIFGRLGTMTVKGDFGANLNVFGTQAYPALGSVGGITILGDLYANDPTLTNPVFGDGAGYLFSSGPMGTVRVAGNVFGGESTYSGSITSSTSITSVSIGGTVYGGSGDFSGRIFSNGVLGSVFVGGSLISGYERDENGTATPPLEAGSISSFSTVAKVTIVGNAIGGMSFFGGSIVAGKIGSVTINGTLSGHTEVIGTGDAANLLVNGIFSDTTIGAVKVGALQGLDPASPVNIVALGKRAPLNATEALAIASVTVVRGAYSAQILAGFDLGLNPLNTDVQIGVVKVGNSWQASSISAGISGGRNLFFGNADDVTIASLYPAFDNPAIHARIASVTISGYVYGTGFVDQDSYAIQAEEIGVVTIGTTILPMTVRSASVPADDILLGITRDFRVREL